MNNRFSPRPCPCGSGQESWWENDARDIPLCRVCEKCIDERLARYCADVLNDPGYECDEPIEEEDY